MVFFGRLRSVLVAATLVCVCAASPARAADVELSDVEIERLNSGQVVVREENIERGGHRYIGGVSYVLIDARPERVSAALDNVAAYRQILPRTRSVRWIGLSRQGGEAVVELEQGNSIAHGKYTVRVRREPSAHASDSATIRFWLDPNFSHDIADINGFFRVEPMRDKTLLTYLVMVDLGHGLIGRLFEDRIRKSALSTPALVKTYVESRSTS
ncbi:MAG TPA: hypothetical protein VF881_14730 [Polyangiaceae bacterium]